MGDDGHWLYGSFRDFRGDPLGFLLRMRSHGDAVPIRMLHRRAVILYDSAAIEQVLIHQHRRFRKHFALRLAKPVVGDGLLTAEGERWVAHRKLAQPAFRSERIAAYAAIMRERVERQVALWRTGEAFDLHDQMMRVTSGIVTAALFGADITERAGALSRAMETLVENFSHRLDSLIPPPLWLPIPRVLRFRRARAELESLVTDAITERRRSGAQGSDLLGALLRAHEQEGGAALSDRELRDEMVTLFVAGHETTANALTWTFWLLARHPEAEAKLHAELDQALAGRAPTPEDVPRLPWLRRVLDESMRVMPPAWIIGREALEPIELAGLRLRRGTTVLMPQWAVHRDPRVFPDPGAFRPERWEDGLAERIPRFAYFPFGGGPRHCIGEHFARLEAMLLLAAIASRFTLRLAPDARVELFPSITLRPRYGMAMIAERRA